MERQQGSPGQLGQRLPPPERCRLQAGGRGRRGAVERQQGSLGHRLPPPERCRLLAGGRGRWGALGLPAPAKRKGGRREPHREPHRGHNSLGEWTPIQTTNHFS